MARAGGHDPLAQLRDLHLPAEPSWFPPAPGWWLLALLCIALAAFGIRRVVRRRRARLPYRAARRALEAARCEAAAPTAYADTASAILKRLTIHVLGQREAAPLSGRAWLEFLDGLAGSRDFTDGPGRILGAERFAPDAHADIDAVHPCLLRLVTMLERRA